PQRRLMRFPRASAARSADDAPMVQGTALVRVEGRTAPRGVRGNAPPSCSANVVACCASVGQPRREAASLDAFTERLDAFTERLDASLSPGRRASLGVLAGSEVEVVGHVDLATLVRGE